MSKEDKESKAGGNTIRAILHFLSGKLGTRSQESTVIKKRILFGIIFGITLAADLVTKWAAFHFLMLGQEVKVISGFFSLRPVWNYGIVFGLPAPIWITSLVSVVATVVVVWYLSTRRGKPPVVQLYLGFILSGVIGNLCDRIVYGAVRDFIELYAGKFHWPNFNLADAFILIGVVLAMIQFILTDDKGRAKQDEKSPGEAAGVPVKESNR